MSVASVIWKSDGRCRENLILGKEERAGQRYYKGFASAHIETPPFIFGKVDVSRSAIHLSLSRLNHGLPRRETHPEVVQGTAQFHHEIADALLPQADPV